MAMPRPKIPGLVQHYVTAGDRGLREWHLLLRRVTFGAAIILMGASVVSLHFACALIGLPDRWYAPIAWIVPLAMETGMAAIASTATTIRKPTSTGREHLPGRYYLSLWVIFSFMMALAQAANIGHAVVVVSSHIRQLPPFIPPQVIYVFACMFAALFPLGGTLLVHVSGFLRVHGTGARWIDDDAEIVMVEDTASPARRAPAGRAAARPSARTATAERATTDQYARADARAHIPAARVDSAPTPRAVGGDVREQKMTRARALFEQMVSDNPSVKPPANVIQHEAGLGQDQPGGMHPGNFRKYVNGWFADFVAAQPDTTAPTRDDDRDTARDLSDTIREAS